MIFNTGYAARRAVSTGGDGGGSTQTTQEITVFDGQEDITVNSTFETVTTIKVTNNGVVVDSADYVFTYPTIHKPSPGFAGAYNELTNDYDNGIVLVEGYS